MVQDYDDYEEDDGAGLAYAERALSAVRRNLLLIGLLTAVGTAVAASYAWHARSYYEAIAIIKVDPRQKSITKVDGVFSDMRGDYASIESEVEVIRSKPLLKRVVEELGLRNDPDFMGRDAVKTPSAAKARIADLISDNAKTWSPSSVEELLSRKSSAHQQPERDYAVAVLSEQISVRRVRNTLLIEIKAYAYSADKAAKIANTLADVYLRDQIAAKRQASTLASDLLEKKLKVLRRDLSQAERDVEKFKGKHGIYESGNLRLDSSELARLMEQTVVARNATAAARAKFEKARRVLDSGRDSGDLADVLQSSTIMRLKDQLTVARRKQAELATKYGPRHPAMKQSIADSAEAERQLNSEINRLVSNVSNEYEVARAREKELVSDLDKLKARRTMTDEVSVTLSELKRKADHTRQIYEALLSRYKSTAETKNMQLPDVRIVERANIPLETAGPKRKRFVILAFMFFFGLSIALVLAREFLTPGISRPQDAERIFDKSHLSSIPALDGYDPQTAPPSFPLRMILTDPRGIYAEAIRSIRRELDITTRDDRCKVIGIASSLPGEGSETIASNIAHHYALTNNRVLLIDGDLRLGNLTQKLAPARQSGLLEILWHGHEPDHAILRDQSTGLHFLPAMGPSPLEPANPELLASSHMRHVLKKLRSQYDTIIFDMPPLLPVIDGRILADYSDKIVFAITWRKTPKQLAKRAMRLLGINQDKVAGVVVNQIDPSALDDSLGFQAHEKTYATTKTNVAA